MKKLLTIASLFLGLSSLAADWQLVWSDPNPAGSVSRYRIVELVNGKVEQVATTTTMSWTISLPAGLHTIGVMATGTNSVDSDVASIPVGVLIAVTNLRVELR